MSVLIPKQNNILLGRWRLKHNHNECTHYIENLYGEPGYPNNWREERIKKLIENSKINKR